MGNPTEDPRGQYEGDPCPNCGYPRKLHEICLQCHAQMLHRKSAIHDRSTSEMIIPSWKPTGHICITSPRGAGHCGHCDTGYICPVCRHNGMQTKDVDHKKPAHFILRCPGCKHEESIHWIEYDLVCPRCGRGDAFGTYTRSLEPIIQCPACGVSPCGEAA